MGIPGLLKEIGKGDRIALSKLAIDHLELHKRPLRIAIDAAIWNFQTQAGQGGKNPALRTLYFRLLRLLALPIYPVFVYDGKNKPLTKRGKTVNRYGTCLPNEMSKSLVARFQFPHHTAPGEAEAECAYLQKHGVVDAVMSQDVDAVMFGSSVTYRDWSKEGTNGNKAPTHVSVLETKSIKEVCRLDRSGMILVALLSGGDYHDGLPGFGPALSCSIARAGFGAELIELVQASNENGLHEWRERLQYELDTNESGYFAKRHKTVRIPESFPDRIVLSYYLEPAVSKKEDLERLEKRWIHWWDKDIDIQALRDYVGMTFDWMYKGGAMKFIRTLAQPLFQHRLKMRIADGGEFTSKSISDRRKHLINDGMPEMRFAAVPLDVVEIDLDAEQENPEFAELDDDNDEEADLAGNTRAASADIEEPSSPTKRRRRPPWNPNAVEKWWVPEALLKLGLPDVVERWEQEQAEIRTDPIKFATRKCKPAKTSAKTVKKLGKNMKEGVLTELLPMTKQPAENPEISSSQPEKLTHRRGPLQRATSNPLVVSTSQDSTINNYFKSSKFEVQAVQTAKPKTAIESILEDVGSVLQLAEKPQTRILLPRSQTMPMAVLDDENPDTSEMKLPPSVTRHRKQMPKRAVVEEGVSRMAGQPPPPPISSFFSKTSGRADNGVLFAESVGQLVVAPASGVAMLKKKLAISRDSLPGAWKESDMTPSQKSRIVFIDLTEDD